MIRFILVFTFLLFASITNAYNPDKSITIRKMGPWEGVKSTSSGSFTTASTSPVNVTNLAVTLKTYGRPVRLQLINNAGGTGQVSIGGSSGTTDTGIIYFATAGSPGVVLSTNGIVGGLGTSQNAVPCSAFSAVAEVIAGTHNFIVQAQTSATTSFAVTNCALMAFEM